MTYNPNRIFRGHKIKCIDFLLSPCLRILDNLRDSTPGDYSSGNTELKTTIPAAPTLPTSITESTIEIFYSLMSPGKQLNTILPGEIE